MLRRSSMWVEIIVTMVLKSEMITIFIIHNSKEYMGCARDGL
jgi:hypothetical protein